MCSMASYADSMPQNMLLAALPEAEWDRVRKSFKPIWMPLGGVLFEPGTRIDHLYFCLLYTSDAADE